MKCNICGNQTGYLAYLGDQPRCRKCVIEFLVLFGIYLGSGRFKIKPHRSINSVEFMGKGGSSLPPVERHSQANTIKHTKK